MSMQLIEPIAPMYSMPIGQAVLETLAYSDVFDFPLRPQELLRYLPIRASLADLQRTLDDGDASVSSACGFYFLSGRESLVPLRHQREAISIEALQRARRIGRLLGSLPFIRMVALTGSLAVLNSERSGDLDYMLVAAEGRLWTARGFSLLLGRLTRRTGDTLCPNLIVSECALEWPKRDVYSAREICQMIPIVGRTVYERLRRINGWTEHLLPNAASVPPLTEPQSDSAPRLQSAAEWPLRGSLGDRLESWEMRRKISRLRHEPGFGIETRFDAQVCQGNFLHHGMRTRQALRARLAELGIQSFSSGSAPDLE